jgi:hypothetical protein
MSRPWANGFKYFVYLPKAAPLEFGFKFSFKPYSPSDLQL